MTQERWQQIEEILQAALDLQPDKRAAFLDKACAGDDELRREVEDLLARENSAEHFIETAAMKVIARGLAESDLSGQKISHYQIIKPIGEGGMGKVYLAADSKLNRNVAIKFLPEAFTADQERVRRFEQEAQAASKLNHPNIVTIHEFGQSNGRHFIVTEYIAGKTLREKLKESPPDIPQIIAIALQVTSALKAAHAANIIHRDIKPENIMLRDDGVVKVLDFGIAKLNESAFVVPPSGGSAASAAYGVARAEPLPPEGGTTNVTAMTLTTVGMIVGTASYMSPEQARGDDVDARSDLFSLGAVLYEMVTRQRLFEGRTQAEVLRSLANNDESPKLENQLSDSPKKLAAIIRLALKKDRDKRYASAEAMFRDLQRLQERLRTQRLRRTIKYVATGLAAAIAIVLTAFLLARGEVWEEHKMNDGHVGHVRRAVFSPDGSKLVSIGEDKQVIVWDFKRCLKLKVFCDHTDLVTALAFSPNGKWFATGSHDKTVIVWDAKSLEKVTTLREHRDQVRALAFSPDSKSLVSISSFEESNEGQTIVWHTSQWQKTWEFPDGTVYGNVLFSSDGRRLITPMEQWDLTSGQKLDRGAGWTRGNWSEFSPDQDLLVTMATDDVFFFSLARPADIATQKLILLREHAHQDFGRAVAFSRDGKLVATGADDIVVWETATRKIWARWSYEAVVWSLAFSLDGKWLVSTHSDGSILLWDVARMDRSASLNGHIKGVRAVAISKDQKRIASASEDKSIIVWNVASEEKEMVLNGHETRITGVVFSPDGKWLVSADQDGFLIRWDLDSRQQKWKIKALYNSIASLAISPDGRWLAVSSGIYDSNEGSEVINFGKLKLKVGGEGVAFSSDGRKLVCVGVFGICIFNTDNWQIVAQSNASQLSLIGVAFSPDGRLLATGDLAGKVMLWDAKTLRPLNELGKHDARIKAVAFSPDGSEVVSCGDDKRIKLWDVGRQRLIRTIGDHSSPVLAIAFSRDGKFIVSGEHDHTVRVYRRHRTWFGSKVD